MRIHHTSLLVFFTLLAILFSGGVAAVDSSASAQSSDQILIYSLSGEITGVTASTVQDVLSSAQGSNARLVVIEVNTPGGEVMAVQSIMQMFATSPIPVLVYVPPASIAVSGGTYLLMASHVAGMGTAAQIGSCQPVLGVVPTYEPKYLEFVVTLMTSHAHLHERNETVASQFILENLNLGATEARDKGVIEFTSASLAELLSDLEAYTLIQHELTPGDSTFRLVPTVDLPSYTNYSIFSDFQDVASAPQIRYLPNLGLTLLGFLANPVVNFILLQIGIWGFIFALNAPGHAGEIISSLCIILALIGMGIIGISIAGIILMFIGIALVIVEAKTDIGFAGAAGIGGTICFALGGVFFLPPSQWLIPSQVMWVFQAGAVGVALCFASLFGYAIMKAAEVRRLTSEFEPELIIGKPGVAETLLNPDGRVRALGEVWTAIAEDPPIKSGEPVEIVRLDGIRLIVRRQTFHSEK